uniref:Nudix hydrolase domain-containing protein n=1 Tax=Scleropages formosus TaxID=113540 RepID=A0A8C9VWQ0_SCLFO
MTLRACGLTIFRQVSQHPPPTTFIRYSTGNFLFVLPGHVDPGVDDMTTALQEIEEEAGLSEQLRIIDSFLRELHYKVQGRAKKFCTGWLSSGTQELKLPCQKSTRTTAGLEWKKPACALVQYKEMQNTLRDAHHFLTAGGSKLGGRCHSGLVDVS